MPGLLLEERAVWVREGIKGRKLVADGVNQIRETEKAGAGKSVKRFSTVVAEVKPGSVAFYAGEY